MADVLTVRIYNQTDEPKSIAFRYAAKRGPFFLVINRDTFNFHLINGNENRRIDAGDSTTIHLISNDFDDQRMDKSEPQIGRSSILYFWPTGGIDSFRLDSAFVPRAAEYFQGKCAEGNHRYKQSSLR